MNAQSNLIDEAQEKRVQIEPLETKAEAPVKRGRGRPRKEPKPKIETHAFTKGRKEALEKARVVKREKAAARKKEAEYQQSLTAKAQLNQGHAYDPSIDHEASLRQSNPQPSPNQGQPQEYKGVNSTGVYDNWSGQTDRMTKIEQLLDKLLNTQVNPTNTPQTVSSMDAPAPSRHHPKVFNPNPWARR